MRNGHGRNLQQPRRVPFKTINNLDRVPDVNVVDHAFGCSFTLHFDWNDPSLTSADEQMQRFSVDEYGYENPDLSEVKIAEYTISTRNP